MSSPRALWILTLPLSLLGVSACDSQPVARANLVQEARVAATPARADAARLTRGVAWLADDVREGRRAGTSKALECADFLAKRFETLGLTPAGDNGYLQEFRVRLAPRTGGGSFVSDAKTKVRIAEGADFVPLFCSEGRAVTGKVAFVGFSIAADDRGWNDFGDAKLDGAIALVVRGVPKGAPKVKPDAEPAQPSPYGTPSVSTGEGWGGDGLIFTKVMNAKRRGAAGVILLPHPDDAEKPLLAFGEGGSARAGIPCAMMSMAGAKSSSV